MTDSPSKSPSGHQSGRYLLVFLLGLMAGIIALVLALRALESRKTWQDHYPVAVMQVLAAQVMQLRQKGEANRCTPADVLPHLQALRLLGNDLEPAHAELADDRRFMAHASDFRGQLDRALADPPHNCALLEEVRGEIGGACKACHQDFRL